MLNVIFDMDGTLIDSEDCICAAVNAIRKDRNLAPLEYEFIKQTAHTPNVSCAKVFYEIDDFAFPSYKVGFESYFDKAYNDGARLFEGVEWLLRECKKRGYSLAIASNAPQHTLGGILEQHKIFAFFDSILGAQIGIESKPSPMMIHKILQNAPFEKSAFVGNGAKDRGAAKNAGIPYLHAKWGANPSTLEKDEFDSAQKLLAMLEKVAEAI